MKKYIDCLGRINGMGFMCRMLVFVALGVSTASAAYQAGQQLIDVSLEGTSTIDKWTNLSSVALSGTGGFPGTTMWGPQNSQPGSTEQGGAKLMKISNGTNNAGGPYAASASIYFGGLSPNINENGGTLGIVDDTPVDNLATVVFQIEIGEAWTYDFFDHVLPELTYTIEGDDSVYHLEATYASVISKVDNGTVTMPSGEEQVYINNYLLQWDFGAVTGVVASFSINFTGVQHAQLYAMQLDQSDIYASVAAVPEPATFSYVAGCLVLLGGMWRYRRLSYS